MAPAARMTDTGGMELREREPSLALLADCAAEARRGDGRLVILGGEAGVCKTARLERFQRELRDARWSWGACDGLFTPRPLGPLYDLPGPAARGHRAGPGVCEPRRPADDGGPPRGGDRGGAARPVHRRDAERAGRDQRRTGHRGRISLLPGPGLGRADGAGAADRPGPGPARRRGKGLLQLLLAAVSPAAVR